MMYVDWSFYLYDFCVVWLCLLVVFGVIFHDIRYLSIGFTSLVSGKFVFIFDSDLFCLV